MPQVFLTLCIYLLVAILPASASLRLASDQSGAVWVPPVSETFGFDAAGNRQSSALWDYGWDGRNKLVRARTKNHDASVRGYDITFGYDAEGRRFKKNVTTYQNGSIVSQDKITFIWDGWDMIYERHQNPSGLTTLERKYVWGPDIAGGTGGDTGAGGAGGLLLIRETRGTQTKDYYPLYDGSGHVIALADSNGVLVAEYAYGPFGELIHARGPMAQINPIRYATKYYDSETGLYYYGERYLDPITGQWLSREPLGESESVNLYAFAGNDPINFVDRLGLAKVAINDDRSLNAFGLALAAIAKEDPQAARSLLLAAQLEAEISGAGLDGMMGDGSDSDASATRRALELAVSDAYGDGRDEWLKIGNAAGLGAGASWWSTELPRSSEVMGGLMSQVSPVLAARADAAALDRARRRAASAEQTAYQNSWSYKWREFADFPFDVAAFGISAAFATDVTTGSAVTWNSLNNGGGLGLAEVAPGERALAGVFVALGPIGRGGNFVDDFVRAGARGSGVTQRVSVFGTYLPHNGKTYVQFAEEIGARRFALPDDKFLKMVQRAETVHRNPLYYNQLYLDSIAKRGDLVRLNISRPEMQAIIQSNPNAFKTLRWEIDDLLGRGYTWGSDLKSLVPPTR